MKKNLMMLLGLLTCLFCSTIFAQSSFIVRNIKIEGLQGVSQETVLSYTPIKVGDRLTTTRSSKIIESLYASGLFENVSLSRKNNILIIKVVQRPIISRITITGNKKITSDKLIEVLKKQHFTEGDVFNPPILEKIKSSLASEYFAIGKYNARINISVTKESRNRVAVKIAISEGKVSKIRQIKIIGNYAYSEKTLLKQMKLTTPGLLTWINHNDQYSSEKLEADLENIRSFYMDKGYLKFNIDSAQVSISPDRKAVYIIIHVTEGHQYRISGYDFSGHLILSKPELAKLVQIKPGQIFSRKAVMDTNTKITKALGDKGYSDATVNAVPKVNENKKTIFLNININPGPRIYVRHVTFSENYRTNDDVLRNAVLQKEGGLISTKNVEGSKRSLLLLPFIRDVDVSTEPVPGKQDQVDVNYKITEMSPAELKAGIGYSAIDKLIINASAVNKSLFGTGRSLGINFSNSRSTASVNLSYFNPYYTASGIGRGINVYGTHFDSKKANITDYATNVYGFSIGYSYPISENNYLNFGYGYENNFLSIGNSPSKELSSFVDKHRRHFQQVLLNAGWSYQGVDRSLFPTKGALHSIGANFAVPLGRRSLEYYTVAYNLRYYHPIYNSFIARSRFNVSYGDGYGRYNQLPFFKNFYAGGMGSVAGYEGNTLGPKDSNGDPLGGNFKVDGSVGVIFPNPISQNLRTTLFVDFGNAYQGFALNMRTSTGLEVDWLSPIGMLNFSVAAPLNKHRGDDTSIFQFNIGTSL